MADERSYSSLEVDGEQAPSRAMLYPTGFKKKTSASRKLALLHSDMVTPCNMHINELAEAAAMGADEAGAKSVLFNTITYPMAFPLSTPGMRYFLVSREVIADSIETVVGAQGFDGFVAIGGCDKNIRVWYCDSPHEPAQRFVYGGTILPGEQRRDIVCRWRSCGRYGFRY